MSLTQSDVKCCKITSGSDANIWIFYLWERAGYLLRYIGSIQGYSHYPTSPTPPGSCRCRSRREPSPSDHRASLDARQRPAQRRRSGRTGVSGLLQGFQSVLQGRYREQRTTNRITGKRPLAHLKGSEALRGLVVVVEGGTTSGAGAWAHVLGRGRNST